MGRGCRNKIYRSGRKAIAGLTYRLYEAEKYILGISYKIGQLRSLLGEAEKKIIQHQSKLEVKVNNWVEQHINVLNKTVVDVTNKLSTVEQQQQHLSTLTLKHETKFKDMHNELQELKPIDCSDLQKARSGVYKIYSEGISGFDVFCEMEKDGGGWTVFQHREDWNAYKQGFGLLNLNFWLGNEHIHKITSQGTLTLRIDLEDFENKVRYAKYSSSSIGSESSGYKLEVNGYNGNAGDSFSHHNGMTFTTKDKDNDISGINCAVMYKEAWWYTECHSSNLNGLYQKGHHTSFADGIVWYK